MLINNIVKYNAFEDLSRKFAALGDPTRLAILYKLRSGAATVKEIAEPFTISLPAISRHLHVLEAAGFISRRHHAQWRECTIEANGIDAVSLWAETYRDQWDKRFDSIDAYLEHIQPQLKPKKVKDK